MSLEFNLIFTQIVAFIIIYYILKRYAWQPLLKIMNDRTDKIQSGFDEIEQQKTLLKQLSDDYQNKLSTIEEEARDKIQDAINEGKKISDEIQANTQAKAKEILEKAKESVENEIAKAKTQLKNDIVNLTIAATEKMIHTKLDDAHQKKLINDFVEENTLK